MAQHAANDAGACGASAVTKAGRFSVETEPGVGGVRYRVLDGGVVVRSGWASDVGLVEDELGRLSTQSPCARAVSADSSEIVE